MAEMDENFASEKEHILTTSVPQHRLKNNEKSFKG